MISFKSLTILAAFAQLAVCLTLIEDVYLTKQLMAYFGDDIDEGTVTNDNGGEKGVVAVEEVKVAPLLSNFDTNERGVHYWTRLGHRTRTQTTPQYTWENYYYNNAPSQSYGLRRRRYARTKSLNAKKVKRQVENGHVGVFMREQNYTNQLPRPMLDYKLNKRLSKCCADTEESTQLAQNENVQSIKVQCFREARKNRTQYSDANDNSTTVDGDGGLYNIFSCDRINRWKATVTCTIACMGQRLEMIDLSGNIDVKTTKLIVAENFATQSWQRGLSDQIVEKCLEEVAAGAPNKLLDKFGLKCNTKMAEFTYCMWREFFLACPAERQQKMKSCERLRTVLRKNSENKFMS